MFDSVYKIRLVLEISLDRGSSQNRGSSQRCFNRTLKHKGLGRFFHTYVPSPLFSKVGYHMCVGAVPGSGKYEQSGTVRSGCAAKVRTRFIVWRSLSSFC